MVYYKSLIVVALCTAFVIGFYAVLQYESAGIGTTGPTTLDTSRTTACPPSDASCSGFSVASVSLHIVNYTDELGPVSYATLAFGLDASGGGPIVKVSIYLNNTSIGTVPGPFEPGITKVVNFTLPATVSVSHGKSYSISVEGYYGTGSDATWQTVEVVAD